MGCGVSRDVSNSSHSFEHNSSPSPLRGAVSVALGTGGGEGGTTILPDDEDQVTRSNSNTMQLSPMPVNHNGDAATAAESRSTERLHARSVTSPLAARPLMDEGSSATTEAQEDEEQTNDSNSKEHSLPRQQQHSTLPTATQRVTSILLPASDLTLQQQQPSLHSDDVAGMGQPMSTTTVSTTASGASSSPLTARPDQNFCANNNTADYFRPVSRSRELGVSPLAYAAAYTRPPLHKVMSHGALEGRSQATLNSDEDHNMSSGSKQQQQHQQQHPQGPFDHRGGSTANLSAAGILRVLGAEGDEAGTSVTNNDGGGAGALRHNHKLYHHLHHVGHLPPRGGSKSVIDGAAPEEDLSVTTMRDILLARPHHQPSAPYNPLQMPSIKSDAASLFSGSLHGLASVSASDSESNGTPKSLGVCSTIVNE